MIILKQLERFEMEILLDFISIKDDKEVFGICLKELRWDFWVCFVRVLSSSSVKDSVSGD